MDRGRMPFVAVILCVGRNESRCDNGGFVREYGAAMRCDVLDKLHSSTPAALLCFDHDRSQRVVFGLCWRTLMLNQSRDRLRVLACSQRELFSEPSAIIAGCHGGVLVCPNLVLLRGLM
jgi:hypothetical protein